MAGSMERICLVFLVTLACSAVEATSSNATAFGADQASSYLEQFHYMGEDNHDSYMEGLSPEEQYAEALRRFQAMAGIPQTGVLDSATVERMQQPRCGDPDSGFMITVNNRKKRYVASGRFWDHTALSYKFENYTPDLHYILVRASVLRAFTAWSDVSPLSFRMINDDGPEIPDISIQFSSYEHGDGHDFDGPGNILAHAYDPGPGIGGDVHFDESELWTYSGSTGFTLFRVAVHEVGHALGLAHSDVPNAVMWPWIGSYQSAAFEMPYDDIHGIQSIYGFPSGYVPRYCSDGEFDAIVTTDDGSTYAFRGEYYFKIEYPYVATGYPRTIQQDWENLPSHIDAAIYWPERWGIYQCSNGYFGWCWGRPGETYFMKGDQVYKFVNQEFQSQQTISSWISGLPNDIDAAFVWGRTGRSYFVKDDVYYQVETHGTATINSYATPLSIWWFTSVFHGLIDDPPDHLDAAFQYTNGLTYFFVGKDYYRFNDDLYRIDEGYPRDISFWWLNCRGAASNLRSADSILPEETDVGDQKDITPVTVPAELRIDPEGLSSSLHDFEGEEEVFEDMNVFRNELNNAAGGRFTLSNILMALAVCAGIVPALMI